MGGSWMTWLFLALHLLLAGKGCCAAHHKVVRNPAQLHSALQDPRVGVIILNTSLTLGSLESVIQARPLLITAQVPSIVLSLKASPEHLFSLGSNIRLRFRQLTICLEDPRCCQLGAKLNPRALLGRQSGRKCAADVLRGRSEVLHGKFTHELLCSLMQSAEERSPSRLVSLSMLQRCN
jgi:hypothetical protein